MGGRVLAEHISERMVVTAGGVRMPSDRPGDHRDRHEG